MIFTGIQDTSLRLLLQFATYVYAVQLNVSRLLLLTFYLFIHFLKLRSLAMYKKKKKLQLQTTVTMYHALLKMARASPIRETQTRANIRPKSPSKDVNISTERSRSISKQSFLNRIFPLREESDWRGIKVEKYGSREGGF